MSDMLRVDLDGLHVMFTNLLQVSIAFSEINAQAHRAADACGPGPLQHEVHGFAKRWDDRRKDIAGGLDALWHTTHTLEKTFRDVDSQMAAVLNGATGVQA